MFCCQENGLESKLYLSGGIRTIYEVETYHDEKGRYHRHDPSRRSARFRCSNGHGGKITRWMKCSVEGCQFNDGKDDPLIVVDRG